MNRTKRLAIIVAWTGLAGFALGIRLWGNTFGLPYAYAPDERYKTGFALSAPALRFEHPYGQPSFLYNSLFLVFKAANPGRSKAG